MCGVRSGAAEGPDDAGARPAAVDASFGSSARPVPFNPGRRSAAAYAAGFNRTTTGAGAVTGRRRRRSGRRALVALLVVAVLGVTGWRAAPAVWSRAEAWSRASVEADVRDVAASLERHRARHGSYTTDRSALDLPATETANQVRIVSADAVRFCLHAEGVLGPAVDYLSGVGFVRVPCPV